jgi:hypothetical protein
MRDCALKQNIISTWPVARLAETGNPGGPGSINCVHDSMTSGYGLLVAFIRSRGGCVHQLSVFCFCQRCADVCTVLVCICLRHRGQETPARAVCLPGSG